MSRKALRSLAQTWTPWLSSASQAQAENLQPGRYIAQRTSRGPYGVIDLRQFEPGLLEGKLFGHDPGSLAFSQLREAGILEQFRGGTIVLYHAEILEDSIRQKLLKAITEGIITALAVRQS